jgi:AhpD family alkylhydroperoxidase
MFLVVLIGLTAHVIARSKAISLDRVIPPWHALAQMPRSRQIPPTVPTEPVVRAIEMVAFEGVQLLDVTGPLQVFTTANETVERTGGSPPYAVRIVAREAPRVTASAGIVLAVEKSAAARFTGRHLDRRGRPRREAGRRRCRARRLGQGPRQGGSFTEAQIQALLLSNAVTNGCDWAVAFHTALAIKEGLEPADVAAIRAGRSPRDAKLGALSTFARALIEKRGRLDDQELERFLAAGFGEDHLLEVIAVVAASTITNYTGSVTKPPLEAQFEAHAWSA